MTTQAPTPAPPVMKECLSCPKVRTKGGVIRCPAPSRCTRKGPRAALRLLEATAPAVPAQDSAPAPMEPLADLVKRVDLALHRLARARLGVKRLKERNPQNLRLLDIENHLDGARKALEGK